MRLAGGGRPLARFGLALLTGLFAAIGALLFPDFAGAHGLLVRQDLPIPEWLFAWAASVVLIVSFFALSVAWRRPLLEEERWRPVSRGISRLLINPPAEVAAGTIGVFLLGFSGYAGIHGTEAPDRNFTVTFIFVTCWLGFPLLSLLLGDVFRPFNPWRAIGRTFGGLVEAVTGQRAAHLPYPRWLGRWPAAIGLLAFSWLELIYGAGGTAGLTPYTTAIAILIYSAITLAMMGLFGVEEWTSRGETFSVFFNMFSQLSPLEVRDGRLGRRRPLAGASQWGQVPGSVALVIASIATTSFDGAQEGALSSPIASTFNRLVDAGMSLEGALRATDTLYLLLCFLGIGLVFVLGVQGMRTVRGSPSAAELRADFGHTLIPIALAYLVAHYFSLFIFQEQAQFTYLLSDPLGTGEDLFGTVGSGINYGLVSSTTVWYVQVGALVVGHVCGLTMAHDKAVAVYGDYKQASRSQYWMLAVMIAFTTFGLYLLSQANR